jgi:dinuclear metal center YbgI/SA1388 family protein
MKLQELRSYLSELFPSEKVVDYCPNGLQVEGKHDIKLIVTAVSASVETIEAAVEIKADALIVHHGIFWQKDSYVIEGVKKKKLDLLLRNEMSLFAYHLPLDSHPGIGNNWRAAYEMGWSGLQPFCDLNGNFIGVRGTVPAVSPDKFKNDLEKYYEHPATCALGGPELIETVALISGGAYKYLTDATQAGVDAFITGSFDEPVWHQAFEERIHFFALGHSATERVGPRALAHYLAEALPISCSFLDIENPF